jgi:CHAT domain-containing protein
LAELPRSLPGGTQLIYFSVLEGSTLRWHVSDAGVEFRRFEIGRLELDYLVRRARRALQERDWLPALRAASKELHPLIVPDGLASGTTLIVHPDGPLHELPVGVLVDPVTSRHLVEDHPVAVAPSLRLFLAASGALAARLNDRSSILIVEGRTGAGDSGTPLPPLPAVASEIRAVARHYRSSEVLPDDRATPERFLELAGRYPIVHFAGHAVADRTTPGLSRLFLAPSATNRSGWLLARDIEAATFNKTALVILGACETGAGPVLRGEGVVNLARPFLGKGAAGVVYSLWDVADNASARLLTAFHRHLAGGAEPILALQHAQLELIRAAEAPGDVLTWSAYQYAGGLRGIRYGRQMEDQR